MKTPKRTYPEVVDKNEWLNQRVALLKKEKEATRMRDAVNAERRRLPMVKVEKDYTFEGPEGKVGLLEIFKGRRQLLVHHFMWFDKPNKFCPGCSLEADQNYNGPFFSELRKRDVTMAAIARAPFSRIEREKADKGWDFPFYSSKGSDFNYDYQATIDKKRSPLYNYQDASAFDWLNGYEGDMPAKSVFLRDGDTIYHCYSAYTRGLDQLATHYNYLDLTPYGRQEIWEDSPEDWPQKPTYG